VRKPKVGERLFVSTTNNLARGGVKTYNCEVVKVGRKYFDVELEDRSRPVNVHINSWHENNGEYMGNYQVWESEQAYKESVLAGQLHRKIREHAFNSFGSVKLSLKQLKAIAEIVGLSEDEL
jgi:hypothetical protein